MSDSKASATWEGGLKGGHGVMKPAHGDELRYSLASRFEGQAQSNPEELIGAALAGCFSMALAAALEREGLHPKSVHTSAEVRLEKQGEGYTITSIALATSAIVPEADPDRFHEIAEETKRTCPVSKALAAVSEVTLAAHLAPM